MSFHRVQPVSSGAISVLLKSRRLFDGCVRASIRVSQNYQFGPKREALLTHTSATCHRKTAMGRKGRGKGRGGGRGRRSGIEKYGQDDADAFLALDEQSGEEAEHEDEEDEDVMALKPFEDESYGKQRGKADKKTAKSKSREEASEESEPDLEPVSKGWGRHDFYGGEDAGDDSEGASDEDRTLKEAKKLEELRALRLQNLSDPLAALLGDGAPSLAAEAVGGDATGATAKSADVAQAEAQFESMFTEEAEKSKLDRDISQLSSAKRKSLLKKEAPELLPLLQDFQSKLDMLSPLVPLLKPGALSALPASGAAYATTRISLLLNHLANLSFYLLMKAEGTEVKSHPVVSQLVWLKELDAHLQPLNKRLNKKIQKVAREVRKRSKIVKPSAPAGSKQPVVHEAPVKSKAPLTLAERLEKLKGKVQKKEKADLPQKPLVLDSALPSSLLKLPKRRSSQLGSQDGPADLDDIDPTLGAWLPSSSLSQQLSEVQQHLRERKEKAVPQASDKNPEARAPQQREKLRLEPDPQEAEEAEDGGEPDEDDDDPMIRAAKENAKAKKERKEAALSAKTKAKVARQYHPEVKIEGRRGTSKQILENRGLVRHRKKKAGNARVSNREKYTKLVKRRKGAVQEMREGASDGATYEGEATGVRTHLRKSLKLS
eukprot:s1957_g25.t1